jgi:hydrogenase maturation protease
MGALVSVASPLVIGVGNADRGDDGVGLSVARRLMIRRPHGVRVVEHAGESMSLLDCLSSAESAYVVDACMAGGPPGTISRFDVTAAALPHVALSSLGHSDVCRAAVWSMRSTGGDLKSARPRRRKSPQPRKEWRT